MLNWGDAAQLMKELINMAIVAPPPLHCWPSGGFQALTYGWSPLTSVCTLRALTWETPRLPFWKSGHSTVPSRSEKETPSLGAGGAPAEPPDPLEAPAGPTPAAPEIHNHYAPA